jgi:hypothetical protein
VLHHVSAYCLTFLITLSTLKQHHIMIPEDKQIWDTAYDKVSDDLNNLAT